MDRLLYPRSLQSLSTLSATSLDQVRRYLNALQARNYAAGTLDAVLVALKRLLRSLSASNPNHIIHDFAQVTAADLDSFIETAKTEGLAPSSINTNLHSLRGFFEFLREEGDLKAQPVISHRHAVLAPTTLPKPMAEADLIAFFKVIDSVRDRLIFLLMLRCGLRVSEACALRWKDLDLSSGSILIINGKGQVDRSVYLAPDVEQSLKLWQLQRAKSDYLFPGNGPKFTHLCSRTVRWLMTNYLRQAGITTPYSPHCLRHTFATELLNAGVTLEVLKELMGHRSLQMTLRYAQLYDSTKRQQYDEAMERIALRQVALRR